MAACGVQAAPRSFQIDASALCQPPASRPWRAACRPGRSARHRVCRPRRPRPRSASVPCTGRQPRPGPPAPGAAPWCGGERTTTCKRRSATGRSTDTLRPATRRPAAQDTALGFAPMRKPRFESGCWPTLPGLRPPRPCPSRPRTPRPERPAPSRPAPPPRTAPRRPPRPPTRPPGRPPRSRARCGWGQQWHWMGVSKDERVQACSCRAAMVIMAVMR